MDEQFVKSRLGKGNESVVVTKCGGTFFNPPMTACSNDTAAVNAYERVSSVMWAQDDSVFATLPSVLDMQSFYNAVALVALPIELRSSRSPSPQDVMTGQWDGLLTHLVQQL